MRRIGTMMAMSVGLALLHAALAAHAAPLADGATLPAITLADQHDASATVGPETRLLLFTRDMDASKITKAVLADDGAAKLARAHATYVADISAMPSLVTTLFAMPGLRKRPYQMLLDRDGTVTKELPAQAGAVTVLTVEGRTVRHVEYVTSAERLRALLADAGKAG